jgi:hypothetical protein
LCAGLAVADVDGLGSVGGVAPINGSGTGLGDVPARVDGDGGIGAASLVVPGPVLDGVGGEVGDVLEVGGLQRRQHRGCEPMSKGGAGVRVHHHMHHVARGMQP